ncbi:hypothetical protein NK6_2007 [Bradyrhizobium diazoefficiens]|uniref:Uncharacterized protein n=1 Tax=Bradyrhizobium diazoefficiens TaxID=1355477 RepID=A0A0E4BLH7_9BRAD|nr:hypothetical protein NK6_2007 [Bradyrhizobium diazoefficiens]
MDGGVGHERRSLNKKGVIPAKAGIHNHRPRLLKRDGAPARHNHSLLWLWIPDRRAL